MAVVVSDRSPGAARAEDARISLEPIRVRVELAERGYDVLAVYVEGHPRVGTWAWNAVRCVLQRKIFPCRAYAMICASARATI